MRAEHLGLTLRVAFGTLWAGVLCVFGLLMASEFPTKFAPNGAWLPGGILMLALGQFVFGHIVADRLFPQSDRRITGAVQLLAASIALTALFVMAYRLLFGR